MADHNDPNAVNHIFSDIDYSPPIFTICSDGPRQRVRMSYSR
jgi:hypothetical protein